LKNQNIVTIIKYVVAIAKYTIIL